jgi:hypothetical protein
MVPQARRRRAAARYPDNPEPGGEIPRQSEAGTDMDPAAHGCRPRRSADPTYLLRQGHINVVVR